MRTLRKTEQGVFSFVFSVSFQFCLVSDTAWIVLDWAALNFWTH